MKKYFTKFIYLVFAIVLVVSLTGCGNTENNSTSSDNATTKNNEEVVSPVVPEEGYSLFDEDGVSFVYNDKWTVQDGASLSVAAFFVAEDGISNFNYVSEKLPLNYSIEQYLNLSKAQLEDAFGTLNYTTDSARKFGPHDGHEVVYVATIEGTTLTFKQSFIIKDKVAYVFTYTAMNSGFDTYLPVVDTMLDSIRIK